MKAFIDGGSGPGIPAQKMVSPIHAATFRSAHQGWLFGWVPRKVFRMAEMVQERTGLPVVQIQGSPREIIFSTTGGYKIALRLDLADPRLACRAPAARRTAVVG